MNEAIKERVKVNESITEDAAICPKCHTKNKINVLYCGCGTAINNVCSHCGQRNLVSAKVCGGCRVKLL